MAATNTVPLLMLTNSFPSIATDGDKRPPSEFRGRYTTRTAFPDFFTEEIFETVAGLAGFTPLLAHAGRSAHVATAETNRKIGRRFIILLVTQSCALAGANLKVEPTTGIEPVTYGLRNRCSTS